MATDARGHTVPAGTDVFDPQGSDTALSLSVNDLIFAANATDAASKVSAIGPTASRPAIVWRQDDGGFYVYNGATTTLIGPSGGSSAFRLVSANNQMNNQTSFGPLPITADQNAASVTLTKKSSATRLLVRMYVTVELTSGVSQLVKCGVSINGGVYSLVAQSLFAAATSRGVLVGEIEITGVAAGTVILSPGLATSTASLLTLYAAIDSASIAVTEAP